MTLAALEPRTRPALAAEGTLAALDALACGTLALGGAALARFMDPWGLAAPWIHVALALPLALVGPLGAGIERGRMDALTAALVTLGAALGALAGALWLDGSPTTLLAIRAGAPLVLGPLLAFFGPRLHRHEEAWRADARQNPPDATPPLALRIAALRLPLPLRIALAPLGLVLVPLGVAGVVLIRCYQLVLSRLMPPQCRFEPSCSRYGFEAFHRLGAVKGFLLTAFRVARCQPFCRSGHDPVPPSDGKERG